jgi:putative endonuclease
MYSVYALYSKSFNKIHIGYSADLTQRLISHNHPRNKGWTRKFAPWVIIFSESFDIKSDAMKREKQLKGFQGRQFIWEQVRKHFSDIC